MIYLALAIGFFSLIVVVIGAARMQSKDRDAMLQFMNQQKVIGGLPPDQWHLQHDLEVRKIALEERKVDLAAKKYEHDQAQADRLFDLDLKNKEVTLRRAEAAAEREGLKGGGGRGVFGS